MTDTALKMKELEAKREIADKDRDQREKASKRQVFSSVLSALIPKSKLNIGRGHDNDPAWYKVFVDTNVNTSIPDFVIQGLPTNDKAILNSGNNPTNDTYSHSEELQPGKPIVYAIRYHDTFGVQNSDYKDNPLNEGWVKFKAELDKRNSVTGAYEASDIGLFILGSISAAQLIMRIQLAIQAYSYYVSSTKAEAPAIIRALGFDYDNFVDNIKQYRSFIVEAISIFNQHIALPADISLTARKLWLSCTIFEDTMRGIGSLCCFTPTNYWCLDETASKLEPTLTNYVPGVYTNGQYNGISTQLKLMLRRLREPKALQRMNADIRGGVDKFVTLPNIIDKPLEFVNAQYAHMQIENMDTVPAIFFDSTYLDRYIGTPTSALNDVIHSDSSGYLWHGAVDGSGYADTSAPFKVYTSVEDKEVLEDLLTVDALLLELEATKLNTVNNSFTLNFHTEKITGDDVLEATRLKAEYLILPDSYLGGSIMSWEPIVCATEIVLRVDDYTYQGNDVYQCTPLSTTQLIFKPDTLAGTVSMFSAAYRNLELSNKVNNSKMEMTHPIISRQFVWEIGENGEINYKKMLCQYQDDEHLLPIQRELVNRINRQCLLSLFVLPKPGKNTY